MEKWTQKESVKRSVSFIYESVILNCIPFKTRSHSFFFSSLFFSFFNMFALSFYTSPFSQSSYANTYRCVLMCASLQCFDEYYYCHSLPKHNINFFSIYACYICFAILNVFFTSELFFSPCVFIALLSVFGVLHSSQVLYIFVYICFFHHMTYINQFFIKYLFWCLVKMRISMHITLYMKKYI